MLQELTAGILICTGASVATTTPFFEVLPFSNFGRDEEEPELLSGSCLGGGDALAPRATRGPKRPDFETRGMTPLQPRRGAPSVVSFVSHKESTAGIT